MRSYYYFSIVLHAYLGPGGYKEEGKTEQSGSEFAKEWTTTAVHQPDEPPDDWPEKVEDTDLVCMMKSKDESIAYSSVELPHHEDQTPGAFLVGGVAMEAMKPSPRKLLILMPIVLSLLSWSTWM